jgi:hypothetical protein
MIIKYYEDIDKHGDTYSTSIQTAVNGEPIIVWVEFTFLIEGEDCKLSYSMQYVSSINVNSPLLPNQNIKVQDVININPLELALYSKKEYINNILKDKHLLDALKNEIKKCVR